MAFPSAVRQTALFQQVARDEELLASLDSLRNMVERLAENIIRTVPAFTDHSIRHMDALWRVSDSVLTEEETGRMTPAEAFLLAAGFYLHDIGMAYASTPEGLRQCRASPYYKSFVEAAAGDRTNDLEALALANAIRRLHAEAATTLATEAIPGTTQHLFEAKSFREGWATTCGRISSSHHWSLERVERELGGGTVPLPGGRKGDLGYVASILRLVDYAHINRDRASMANRAFRGDLNAESLLHWQAQEHIDGPHRDGEALIYRASCPLENVDAWWLYYEMLVGLDAEIRAVRRLFERSPARKDRMSLQLVRGATSPEEAAIYIPPSGFLPIEISLRTGSIDRLVKLLAGETLYGADPGAAVRELLQNARDAVFLKRAMELSEADKAVLDLPIRISMKEDGSSSFLEIADHGVGMSKTVMTEYLLTIASDYWNSQFHSDYPAAVQRGFKPAGKFGIGFLSVFMLGTEVSVESNRADGDRLQLLLHGIGRRGEVRTAARSTGSGTRIRVKLEPQMIERLSPLKDLVKAYAPLLGHRITIEEKDDVTDIPPDWLFSLDAQEFRKWVLQALNLISTQRDGIVGFSRGRWHSSRWGGKQDDWGPELPEYADGSVRLVASFDGVSLLCIKGLALQVIRTPGFVGVIDLDSAEPDVSRTRAVRANYDSVLEAAIAGTRPQIVAHLNGLVNAGFVIEKYGFLTRCIANYGPEVIRESSIPWISALRLPGAVDLVSSKELMERLAQSNSLFIAICDSPWHAMKLWAAAKGISKAEIAIAVDLSGMGSPRYASGDTALTGSLEELWVDHHESALFSTLVSLVAEVWQASVKDLVRHSGWQHQGSQLWGRLSRG